MATFRSGLESIRALVYITPLVSSRVTEFVAVRRCEVIEDRWTSRA